MKDGNTIMMPMSDCPKRHRKTYDSALKKCGINIEFVEDGDKLQILVPFEQESEAYAIISSVFAKLR